MRFIHFAQANISAAIHLFGIALLYLLHVAQVLFQHTFADGKGAVAKVHQHFAALQIIAVYLFAQVAFRCVRQCQYG